jgi:nicotinate-nucleotide pyrophosphorylase (carboxylating)
MERSADWLTPAAHRLIDLALEEDLGRGDVTTDAVIDAAVQADAHIVAREPVVVAGLPVAAEVFRRVDPALEVETATHDGQSCAAGAVLLRVRGPARGILRSERTALNFLQRLSGIATTTRAYVNEVAHTSVRIADTRKTYPGARVLEKLAVRAGGGSNHRFDLGSGVLIKDNHLAAGRSLTETVRRARAGVPHSLRVEVEVDDAAQLEEAIAAGADIILLDNFSTAQVQQAVQRVARATPRPLLEVSGGVTLARVRELAEAGVDIISAGALTHSARAVDLSLELTLLRPDR